MEVHCPILLIFIYVLKFLQQKVKNINKKPEWACFLGECHFFGLSSHTYIVNHNHVHITAFSRHRVILCLELLQRQIWTTPTHPKSPTIPDDKPYSLSIMGIPLCSDPRVCCISLLLFNKSVQTEGACPAKEVGPLGFSGCRNRFQGQEQHLSCSTYSAQDQTWCIEEAL